MRTAADHRKVGEPGSMAHDAANLTLRGGELGIDMRKSSGAGLEHLLRLA